MKDNEKKIIAILVVIVIVVAVVAMKKKSKSTEISGSNTGTGVSVSDNTDVTVEEESYVDVTTDGTKLNVNSKISETKVFGDYEVSNAQLTGANNETQLLAEVKNVGEEKAEETKIKIKLLDKQGQEIATMDGMIGTIEVGESTQLNVSITEDIVDAYDFTIEIAE